MGWVDGHYVAHFLAVAVLVGAVAVFMVVTAGGAGGLADTTLLPVAVAVVMGTAFMFFEASYERRHLRRIYLWQWRRRSNS